MKKIEKYLFLVCSVVLLSGCNSLKDAGKDKTKLEFASSNYPWIFGSVRKELIQGDLAGALDENSHIGSIKQLKNLNELESGRLLQLNDDYKNSINYYNKALKSIPNNKESSLKQAKKILLDKNAYNYYNILTAYHIPDYAISFLYTYQALNYLKINDINSATKSLDNLENAKIRYNQEEIIAGGMKLLGKKDLKRNDITSKTLGLNKFKDLSEMINISNRIPNAYGNPMSYYLRAILESAISKSYNKSTLDLEKAQQYTVGNKYLEQTLQEFKRAKLSETSPFSMGMGRVVVFYEQGLINIRKSKKVPLDLGNIGIRKLKLPIYKTNYSFFPPKKVLIFTGDKKLVDTYTETLLDGTLFAIKSLVDSYSKTVTQNVVIEAFKYDYDKNFPLGGLLGSTLKFDLSKTDPKRADLRSWLLLPNSIDLFEQQLDSGNYTIQVNNIRQKIEILQGKTTLLWIVDIGKFKKVYYFVL